MAVLTLSDFQTLFFNVTQAILAMPTGSVRRAYQGQSQPAQEISQNVTYLYVTQTDNPYDQQRDTIYHDHDKRNLDTSTYYTRVMQCQWSFYGPSAYDNSDTLRFGLLEEPATALMHALQVYPVTDIAAPTRLPYLLNAQWWERSDIIATFYAGTRRDSIIPAITSANVGLYEKIGLVRTAIIPERP